MTSVLIFNKPPSVDAEIVEKCNECGLYSLRECRCRFDVEGILEKLPNSTTPVIYCHNCITPGYYYTITIECTQDKLKVKFGDIEQWEVNEKITREILITLKYRVNRYLIENGYKHLFFGDGICFYIPPSQIVLPEPVIKQRIKNNCVENLLLEGIINNNKPMFLNEIKEQIRVLDWLVFDDENITPPTTLTKVEQGKWVVGDKPYLRAKPVDDDLSILLANEFYGHTILVENLNIHHYRMNNNYKLELVDSYLLVFDTGELEELEVVFDNWKKEHPRK